MPRRSRFGAALGGILARPGRDAVPGGADRAPASDRRVAARLAWEAVRRLVWLGGYGAAAGTLLGYLGGVHWVLDLFSHFRVQYALALVVAVTLHGVRRRWLGVAPLALALTVNLIAIAPLYSGPDLRAAVGSGQAHADTGRARGTFSLLVYNLNWANSRREDTLAYLAEAAAREAEGPDVVALIEIDPAWVEPAAARFPGYRLIDAGRTGGFAMAVLARPPVAEATLLDHDGAGLPAVELVLERDETRIAVLVVHPPPPIKPAFARLRDRLIASVGDWAEARTEPVVVAGDFNATPWSHAMRSLLGRGRLMNSQWGFGVQATWPGSLWPLSIPIDHVLHSRELVPLARTVGPFVGSDHRPVRVTLTLR